MAAKRHTDETLIRTVALYEKHKGSVVAAAREADLPYNTYASRLAAAAKRGFLGTKPVLPGFAITHTTTVQTPDGIEREFIQTAPEKPEPVTPYSVPDGMLIKEMTTHTDAAGNILQQWTRAALDTTTSDIVAALTKTFEAYEGHASLIPAPEHADASLLSVYPLADIHHGLMAWGRETGENYDLDIGAARLRAAMSRLVSQSPVSKQAIVLGLGDWFHNDDASNRTPASGNQLDVDGRYFKVLSTGVQLFIDCVDLALLKHQDVYVRVLPGNHDPHAALALTIALDAFYKKNDRVHVDTDPGEFMFYPFGATLIGAHHGHRAKPERLAMAMATMNPSAWGVTKYRHFLTGHVHHKSATTVGDVRVESFETIAANDAWHHASGYTAPKSLTSITYHVEEGEIGRHLVNIAPQWVG